MPEDCSTPAEEWRAVVGWEGVDEVSALGRVRSVARDVVNTLGVTHRRQSVIRETRHGGVRPYGVHMSGGGRRATGHVHQMVMEAFVGSCPAGTVVCHNNGDPFDNRLA